MKCLKIGVKESLNLLFCDFFGSSLMLMNPYLIYPLLNALLFLVSLQGKMGEVGETGPKGFPVSSLIHKEN